ncbi:MAG: hypothetical protein MJK04_07425 [Psychrosphaera sp.]|nr:hypothetical protein [Psychrosphaera sp.]
MPAINDQGKQVPVVADFIQLSEWIAPNGAEFKKVIETGISNHNNLDMGDLFGYIPNTYSGFAVKNVAKQGSDDEVCQLAQGPWADNKMETAMLQLDLKLARDDNNDPILINENVKVLCDRKVELQFTGGWYIRSWKIDLVIKLNDNGIREVQMLRDEVKWVLEEDDHNKGHCKGKRQGLEVSGNTILTCSYWIPYD